VGKEVRNKNTKKKKEKRNRTKGAGQGIPLFFCVGMRDIFQASSNFRKQLEDL